MIIGYLFNNSIKINNTVCDITFEGIKTIIELKNLILNEYIIEDEIVIMINLAYDLHEIKSKSDCTTYLGKYNTISMIYTIFKDFINYLISNGRTYIENDIHYEEYPCKYYYDKLNYTYELTRRKNYLCIYCYS
jgi:hypothetical protein